MSEQCLRCKQPDSWISPYGRGTARVVYIRETYSTKDQPWLEKWRWRRIGLLCLDCLREIREAQETKAKKKQ